MNTSPLVIAALIVHHLSNEMRVRYSNQLPLSDANLFAKVPNSWIGFNDRTGSYRLARVLNLRRDYYDCASIDVRLLSKNSDGHLVVTFSYVPSKGSEELVVVNIIAIVHEDMLPSLAHELKYNIDGYPKGSAS